MEIQNVLTWANQILFEKTGKHLSSLQRGILTGVWNYQKYGDIAKNYNCSEPYTKANAAQLWKILSESLGENLKKSNFRSTMERYNNSKVLKFGDIIHIGDRDINNFCISDQISFLSNQQYSPPISTLKPKNTKLKQQIDLRDAPNLTTFFDRTEELANLKQWILQEGCRVVTILGITGIGKTAITRQLIPMIQTEFDCIIWRSLRTFPPLEVLLKDLIKSITHTEIEGHTTCDAQLGMLIEGLRDRHCLIILDDVQYLFKSGQLAGNYQTSYQDYRTLFKLIAEFPHNSCFILNSWEPPLEIMTVNSDNDNSAVRLFQLQGMEKGAIELLKNQGLEDEKQWSDLIRLYQGNPLWLRLVSRTIKQLFSGKVSEYLQYQPVFLGDELINIIQQQFNRLSDLEKQVITIFCSEPSPMPISVLVSKIPALSRELFQVILSLERRGWIEKNVNLDQSGFTVQLVLKQYVTDSSSQILG